MNAHHRPPRWTPGFLLVIWPLLTLLALAIAARLA